MDIHSIIRPSYVLDLLPARGCVVSDSEFMTGRKAAQEEVRTESVYDVPAAIMTFKSDPPDTEFQWGYFSALLDNISGNALEVELS